jgi:hypothetical protein
MEEINVLYTELENTKQIQKSIDLQLKHIIEKIKSNI